MSTNLLLPLLLLLLLPQVYETRRLDDHVSHYEELSYDSEALMRQHYQLSRSGVTADHIKLSFSTHGRQFNLRLKPDDNTYFTKDLELVVDGRPHSRSQVRSFAYIGHDVNDPSAQVHGNLAFGVFDGAIHTKDEVFHIEPASRYLDHLDTASDTFHSIAYRQSDVVNLKSSHRPHSTCGAVDDTRRRFLARIQTSATDLHSSSHMFHSSHLKRQARDTRKVSCWFNIVADHFFYQSLTTDGASQSIRIAEATSILRNIIASASKIYQHVDFNSDGSADGINFAIQRLEINTTSPGGNNPFANEFLGVTSVLNKFSENDWSDYCLSYIFTNRDFDDGVLGLAFVGDEVNRGGICDKVGPHLGIQKTLNTGVVTMVNYRRRVTNVAAALTFAHETGHNFGSEHDTTSCSPSDNRYIMTAYANDGSQSNNRKFSACSITDMDRIIALKGQNSNGCLRESTDLCGNGLLDDGEDCDCGFEYDRGTGLCNSDQCCDGSSCRIANTTGVVCSPQSSSCCASDCTIIPQSSGHVCFSETECAYSQTCNGTSPMCPEPIEKEGNGSSIACNSGSNYCVQGECTGSICVPLNLPDCECSEEEYACHICCRIQNGTCTSTITLAQNNATARDLLPNNQGKVLIVGFPCQNYTGYCDFYNKCRPVKEQGALQLITDFLTGSTVVQTAITWAVSYWWAGVLIAVVVLIVLFLIVLGCHCILPRPEHMRKRTERRRVIRKEHQSVRQEHHLATRTNDSLWIENSRTKQTNF